MNDTSQAWWRRRRWQYAGASFLLGVAYTGLAMLLGAEVQFGGRDVTILAGGFVEVSFAVFGWLLGLTAEARHQERTAARRIQDQLEELATARTRLAQQEKLASLGQLAGAIAHEVRNPLAIIRSLVQNLDESLADSFQSEGRAQSEGRETCRLLIEEIDRLAHVTSTLVSFAKPLTFERTKISAARIAERTELLARQMLDGQDVRLTLIGTGDPTLEADPDLLCQVLLGLLENATEASPNGGEIELAWRRQDDSVSLSVTDQGPGIPEELRERIFEPFFTTRDGGNGLGLAVARQIVEAHGGRIAAIDSPARGTCFEIQLPAATQGALETAA